jgi:hypothetical protein
LEAREAVAFFENVKEPDPNTIVFKIAQYIEVSGLPYSAGAIYIRGDVRKSREEWWNDLTTLEKRERLRQAMGAWTAIQDIGVDQVMNEAFKSYMSEK